VAKVDAQHVSAPLFTICTVRGRGLGSERAACAPETLSDDAASAAVGAASLLRDDEAAGKSSCV